MIRIEVRLDRNGLVRQIESSGHAGRFPGADVACGIVSHVLRGFGRTVAARSAIPVDGMVPRPGRFGMVVGEIPETEQPWYRGVCDVLIQWLRDFREDFSGQVDMNIINSEQETRNGS